MNYCIVTMRRPSLIQALYCFLCVYVCVCVCVCVCVWQILKLQKQVEAMRNMVTAQAGQQHATTTNTTTNTTNTTNTDAEDTRTIDKYVLEPATLLGACGQWTVSLLIYRVYDY